MAVVVDVVVSLVCLVRVVLVALVAADLPLVFLVRVALVALAAADLAVAFLVGVVPAVAVVLALVGVAA